jgi:hypothetical protein
MYIYNTHKYTHIYIYIYIYTHIIYHIISYMYSDYAGLVGAVQFKTFKCVLESLSLAKKHSTKKCQGPWISK